MALSEVKKDGLPRGFWLRDLVDGKEGERGQFKVMNW